jgi:divalent metal cation (Fe/Co/Zn/Cd) transporter
LGIGIAILGIVWQSARDMWHRMMDAVDPALSEEFRHIASHVDGVMDVHSTAIRWVGHRLWGEMHVTVNCKLSVLEGHFIMEEVRHALFHRFPAMVEVIVHADPCECDRTVNYHPTAHHSHLSAAND